MLSEPTVTQSLSRTSAIHDPQSIEKVLRAMKLPFHAPELAPARA
ncbi:MAG: hypothetical protein ACI9S9_003177, partial [Planctomycetota bacterium]